MEKADLEGIPSSSQTSTSAHADGEVGVPPRMQHLFVMRHGDRLDDADHDWIFKTPRPWDPPLTDTGKQRARKVGRSLQHQNWNITRVVCSPFLRCIQTASEVVIGLCALDAFNDDSAEVALDPSKVKVSIEYGLCEVMNSYAIRVPDMPPTGPTTLPLEDLEALLPRGTVDATVPKIMTKLPDWRETLDASHKRYTDTFQAIANMFPGENVLCVTHGEGVSVSVTQCHNVTVYQVRYCAISHLQRPIHSLETPPAAGPFELITKPGDDSGLSFSKRVV